MSKAVNLHLSLIGQSQVSLRSVSDQSQVSLRSVSVSGQFQVAVLGLSVSTSSDRWCLKYFVLLIILLFHFPKEIYLDDETDCG